MVESESFDLFPKHFIDKQLEITYSGGMITNEELFSESMEIYEILCNEKNLRFGKCNPVRFKIKNANVFIPLAGQEITVQMKLEGHHDTPFQLGKYKVFSDQPTADRRWRDIVAYDSMYEILNTDVAAWYNEVLPDMESQVTMREFRRSFLDQFGIEESDPEQELVNDSMVVQRTVETGQLSGKDVITAICKINACFGHINREGKFSYIYLPQLIQGLYPANDLYPDHAPDYLPYQQETGHLYPQDPKGVPIGQNGSYISCKMKWGHKKYTKNDMSADLGVERKLFDMYWDEKEQARYLGHINFEDSLLYVCQSCGIDVDPLMLSSAVEQRIQTKSACFAYVIPEIFQLLKNLKAKGLQTAILSNCSSEEVTVLKESAIYPYFDEVILSYEVHMQKPDPCIYEETARRLGVACSECVFVGDGGSNELVGAKDVGMKAIQAKWYTNQHPYQRENIDGFLGAEAPLDIMEYMESF